MINILINRKIIILFAITIYRGNKNKFCMSIFLGQAFIGLKQNAKIIVRKKLKIYGRE